MAGQYTKYYKGRGIVLSTLKYGDSSLIVYMLTDVGGRRTFMVQGLGKGKGRSSKLALFQPIFPLEFEGMESTKLQMHRFREVHSALALRSIPFDVRKSTVALFMAEVIYRLVRECEAHDPLFEFIWHSIEALDRMEEGVADFHLWFMTQLTRFLGFCPGNDYTEGAWFDIREGLYRSTKPNHPTFMSREQSFLLDQLLRHDVDILGHLGLNRSDRVDFLNAMLVYFGYHLEAIGSVQSVRILSEVF